MGDNKYEARPLLLPRNTNRRKTPTLKRPARTRGRCGKALCLVFQAPLEHIRLQKHRNRKNLGIDRICRSVCAKQMTGNIGTCCSVCAKHRNCRSVCAKNLRSCLDEPKEKK